MTPAREQSCNYSCSYLKWSFKKRLQSEKVSLQHGFTCKTKTSSTTYLAFKGSSIRKPDSVK